MEFQPTLTPPGTTSAGRCRHRSIKPGQARPSDVLVAFFTAALAMLAAAAAAVIVFTVDGLWWLHWLALHLALLGGVSQLVLGAGQFFVCAFLATTPPSRRLLAGQLAVWNGGTALVSVGVPTEAHVLVDGGGVLIGVGLLLFAVSLRSMQHRSLQTARWAVRWYQASASCLAAGALIGVLLAGGVAWGYGSLLGAHLALNLIGWLGTAIVGTLHTFFPSLTGTRLRFERLQGPTFTAWLLGAATITVSAAFGVDGPAVAGWLMLLVAATLLAVNVAASLRARPAALSLAARLVALAQGFLVAGLSVALVAAVGDGAGGPLDPSARPAIAALLLAGWIGMTVAGSLLHLLAVLARVRHVSTGMPTSRPVRDRATTGLCAVAVLAWALATMHHPAAVGSIALGLRLAATAALGAQVMGAALHAGRSLTPRRSGGSGGAHAVSR